MSSTLQLALLIVALYGSTCVVWLYADDAVVEWRGTTPRLRLSGGLIRFAGRSALWLNPLTPWRATFRGSWGRVVTKPADAPEASAVPDPAAQAHSAVAYARLAPAVGSLFVLVVVALPALLLGGYVLQATLAAASGYLVAVVALVRVWRQRDAFGLDGRRFALIAFESLACLPFAAGLTRRLSAATPWSADLAQTIEFWPPAARAAAVAALLDECADQRRMYDDATPEAARLDACAQALRQLVAAAAPATAQPAEDPHPQDATS